jgi:hypothetical protein
VTSIPAVGGTTVSEPWVCKSRYSPGVTGRERAALRAAALERRSFTFQPRRPLQVTASARWWYWVPLVLVVGLIVAAVLLGRTSPKQSSDFATGLPEGPPAGEVQVVDRSVGNGWSIRAFDNASAGSVDQPQIAYELIEDGAGVQVRRGPLPFGTTPHLAVPGLALMRGDADGEYSDGTTWRWTTFYAVTDPSITFVRAVVGSHVVDSMRPVKLDDLRFVILTADEDASRVHIEGLSRTGGLLASLPLVDPTFGKAIS